MTSQMESAEKQRAKLRQIADEAREGFSDFHQAREQALRLSREIIRNCANSIRATHRGEFQQARELINTINDLAGQFDDVKESHPAVYYAGYVEDALKEYVEANATLAFAEGSPLPMPQDLKVGPAPYLGGLADTAGELRRFILDSLRRDDFSRCEELLDVMDEIYTILVTMDFPDAVTRGLRRNTDMVRGVLERTRGDLTVALRQRRLEEKLAEARES
ncbi:MAG: haloacid dehalogenase [Chloroflexi bacterium]|nr:haloacid dehalogenase [Chloroflexota bacterium]MDA1226462.1 haloacid dehalogenase [Chloroflexota bacterium]